MPNYIIIHLYSYSFQMEMETAQFIQERGERIRLLREKQERELYQFDDESTCLGFRLVAYYISSIIVFNF